MYPFEGFGRPIEAKNERYSADGTKTYSPAAGRTPRHRDKAGQKKPHITAGKQHSSSISESGASGSPTSLSSSPRGPRWECRLVTPILGGSLECCQGEGCGVVMCGQPCSFFGDYCCSIKSPDVREKKVFESADLSRRVGEISIGRTKKRPFFSSRKPSDTSTIHRAPEVNEQPRKWRAGESGGIKIFVGTWNTGYQEIPSEYMATVQERRPSLLSTSKRCYTAQQLHASYIRNVVGIASGQVGGGLQGGSVEKISSSSSSDTVIGERGVQGKSSGSSITTSPGASITTAASTTAGTASTSPLAGIGMIEINKSNVSSALDGLVRDDSGGGSVDSGTEKMNLPGSEAPPRRRYMAAAAAGIAAAGVAAAGAAGGAAFAAARGAAAAAGAALSPTKSTTNDGKIIVTTTNGFSDNIQDNTTYDFDDEEPGDDGDESNQNAVTRLFLLSSRGPDPLADWLKPGYDVYVITLQEVINDKLYDIISSFLDSQMNDTFLRVEMGQGKISGLGKGAWTRKKATAVLNASKGAVTLALKIFDQYICFIGCHLPASAKERARCRSIIQQRTAAMYSTDKYVDFTRVFHHIIWAGDFNFRCQCSSKTALSLLKENRLNDLLQYDECAQEVSRDMELNCWVEPPIRFLPTYKKRICRPALNKEETDWAEQQYETMMKKRVLGTTKYVERTPSWCDRIFRWSAYGLEKNLMATSEDYAAAEPKAQNYFMASDHAPVGCGFQLKPLNPAQRGRAVFIEDYIAKLPSDILDRKDAFTTLKPSSPALNAAKRDSVLPPVR